MKDDPSWFILHPSSFLTLRTLAKGAQVFQGVDAAVVAIAPDDLVGVAADDRHAHGGQGDQLVGLEDAERVRRLLALVAAAGARAVLAQMLPGVDAAVAVVPLDDEP